MHLNNIQSGYSSNFFYYNEVIRKISGLWIPGKQFGIVFRILYFSYVLIMYIMGILFIFLEILALKKIMSDINALLSLIGMLLTHIVGLFKLMILTFGRQRIRKLMESLQDFKYQYRHCGDHRPDEIFLREKKINSVINITIFVMYTSAAIFAIISMYMRVLTEVQVENFYGTNVTCDKYLPYVHHILLPINTKTRCLKYSFYQGISVLNFAWIVATSDGLFIGLNNCLQAQLKILGGAFRTIRVRSLENLGLPINYEILYDDYYPKLEEDLFKTLSHFTNHLKLLISVREKIEYMFSFITLFQTLASLLIIASCLFVASTIPVTSPAFFTRMQYFFCVLIQLFLICWSGNRITLAAGRITSCLYEADWLSCSRRFKKSLLLTMIRMKRPLYLSIGKFSPLTIATIIVVCRGSFSYFTLFKSIQ